MSEGIILSIQGRGIERFSKEVVGRILENFFGNILKERAPENLID